MTLAGTLNLSDQGGQEAGIQRLFSYGGTLTDQGLLLGTTPPGVPGAEFHIQTSVAGQINLVSAVGTTLSIWDGEALAQHDNGKVDGGSGVWRAADFNWTDSTGVINGPYQPGLTFAIFQGMSGTVTVDRSAGIVGATGMQFVSDGYEVVGDPIVLQGVGGVSIIRVGDGTRSGTGVTASIASSLRGATRLVKSDAGTLVLKGINTYTGGTRIDGGVLSVSSDANLGEAAGALVMNGGTLATTASFDTLRNVELAQTGRFNVAGDTALGLQGGITGVGGLTKQGAGTLRLLGTDKRYTGLTEVSQGTLQAGAAQALASASIHRVDAGASLDLAGFSQTVAGLTNRGLVTLSGPEASVPGTVLKVTGPYVGTGGTLALSTVLGGPGSATDQMLLSGGSAVASGNTVLQIRNAGGLGAQTDARGIVVVDTENGARLLSDAFTLAGGHVDAGAFEYRLQNNGAQASLHSTNTQQQAYRAETALLSALPSQLRQADLAMLGNLHQRVGDSVVEDSAPGRRRTWGRVLRVAPDIRQPGGTVSPHSTGHLTGFQVGLDLATAADWQTGLYVGQLDGTMDVTGFVGGVEGQRAGSNSLRSRYLGAYGTYRNLQGLYADAVLQAADYRSTLHTEDNARAVTTGRGWQASLELGQAVQTSWAGGWTLEPQAQWIYRHIRLDDTELSAARVQSQVDDDWVLRLGARIKGRFATDAGVFQPYVRANVYKSARSNDVSAFIVPSTRTDIHAPGGSTGTELALGGTLQQPHGIGFYGELSRLWAHGGAARVSSNIRLDVGVKMGW